MQKKDHWFITIFILTFVLSGLFSAASNIIVASFNEIVLTIILISVIILGIIFDMIGTSAITGEESAFHAMCSKKIKGAKEALNLIKNSNKISSICNDVIGDICGIISGGLGAFLSISLANTTNINNTIISVIISSFISSATVGGKAILKKIAIKNNTKILFMVGKFLNFFRFKK